MRYTLTAIRSMVILGIDPGFARLGYAVIKKDGQNLSILKYGCLETKSDLENVVRLQSLTLDLKNIVREYRPDVVGVEKLFFFKNKKTVIQVAEARGMILSVLGASGARILEYTPLEVKQALTGYGRATKDQVQKMLMQVFKLKTMIRPDDAADAVAIAYTAAVSER